MSSLRVAPPPHEPPPWDAIEAKLRPPALRKGTVSRTSLVNQLRAERSLRLATVIAPPGYGKTVTLTQWAGRDERPFAWLSADERDNGPLMLLRHLAAALDRVEPLETLVTTGIAVPGSSIWSVAVPRLMAAVAAASRPFVMVVDDAHLLGRGDPADIMLALADAMPRGSMLVLAGRFSPPLPVARLRAAGRLLELGAEDLAMSRREAQLLLRQAGVDPDSAAVGELLARAEGWPAGLFLAARALAEDAEDIDPALLHGDDRFLAEYFRAELLDLLPVERRAFMRRTSVLESMSGSLCDAVLARRHAGRELDAISRANLYLVALDRHGGWCRYQHFLRDELQHELETVEPEIVPVLHHRAADWFEARGELEAAVRHAEAAGSFDRAARLLAALAFPAFEEGRLETVERWLDRFAGETPLARYPDLAVLAAWVYALRGREEEVDALRPAAADDASERSEHGEGGSPGQQRLLRAALAPAGLEEMAADLAAARPELPAASPWLARALALDGVLAALLDDQEAADAALVRAAAAAERLGVADVRLLAGGMRSVLAAAGGDHGAAEELALDTCELLEDGVMEDCATGALVRAVAARACLRHGRWDDARRELEAAERLERYVTGVLPWLALHIRLELGCAYLALRDEEAARRQVDELDALLAGTAVPAGPTARVRALREQLDALAANEAGRTRLTSAELRLVPYLATHLSFREIGDRLFVSRNTIKTQAISVYRKLGVTSRSAAIERAIELGLVEDLTAPPEEFTLTR